MTLSLGIDTGGTFTDAVIIDNDQIVGRGKALTTRADLGQGIQQAAMAVVSADNAARIERVCLSTTLATNAMVEGHGRPAGLIMIGQPDGLLERARLRQALGSDPVIQVAGGHTAHGDEQNELDENALREGVAQYADKVSGFAVAAYFAVRNPTHEQRARTLIEALTTLPVTCSHELSARLDAPRRALTALLNARLVPLLTELITAVEDTLQRLRVDAPLMIVQGDGSLVLASVALTRPVETILSGPAASVLGAKWLSGMTDAMVSDMGGTTTDIAVLENGLPQRDLDGARVGGWHTMVEAIAVHTHALGGDSEVAVTDNDQLTLGPQRAIPLSLLASQFPQVLTVLNEQTQATSSVWDGRFAQRIRQDQTLPGLTKLDRALLEQVGPQPVAFTTLMEDPRLERPLERLRRRGIIAVSQFTPSDALHVMGQHNLWSVEAATAGARLLVRARQANVTDSCIQAFCERVIREVTIRTGVLLTEAALISDTNQSHTLTGTNDWLVDAAIRQDASRLLQPRMTLRFPVIAIGAPAHAYYPALGERLATQIVVPDGAEVCNAVGAAVSGIVRRATCTLTSPAQGIYRVHADFGVRDFQCKADAVEYATQGLEQQARQLAIGAGCQSPNIQLDEDYTVARAADGTEVFVEGQIRATAHGQ